MSAPFLGLLPRGSGGTSLPRRLSQLHPGRPPHGCQDLVSRMAVSWCSGWASPFMLMLFCHLQKLLRVLSA